jgi:hypothetical protein
MQRTRGKELPIPTGSKMYEMPETNLATFRDHLFLHLGIRWLVMEFYSSKYVYQKERYFLETKKSNVRFQIFDLLRKQEDLFPMWRKLRADVIENGIHDT